MQHCHMTLAYSTVAGSRFPREREPLTSESPCSHVRKGESLTAVDNGRRYRRLSRRSGSSSASTMSK